MVFMAQRYFFLYTHNDIILIKISLSLESTDSRAAAVHAQPFSTSALKGLAGVFS